MKCVECGKEMTLTSNPMEAVVHGQPFTVHGIEHWQCECGNDATDAANLKKLSNEAIRMFRETNGLLAPEEIREIRKGLGLNQQQMEQMLGVSTPTVSRWETGTVVQPKPIDNLLRGISDHPCYADDLMRRAEIGKSAGVEVSLCAKLNDMRRPQREMSVNYG